MKTKTMRLLLSTLVLFTLNGCITQLDMTTLRIPCDRFKNPKETIKKVYSQQIDNRSPNSLEITDDYIAWSKEQVKGGNYWTGNYGSTTINNPNAIYYESITKLIVIHKKRRYEIRILNKANGINNLIFLKDKDLAIQGYSAIKCMMEAVEARKDSLF